MSSPTLSDSLGSLLSLDTLDRPPAIDCPDCKVNDWTIEAGATMVIKLQLCSLHQNGYYLPPHDQPPPKLVRVPQYSLLLHRMQLHLLILMPTERWPGDPELPSPSLCRTPLVELPHLQVLPTHFLPGPPIGPEVCFEDLFRAALLLDHTPPPAGLLFQSPVSHSTTK